MGRPRVWVLVRFLSLRRHRNRYRFWPWDRERPDPGCTWLHRRAWRAASGAPTRPAWRWRRPSLPSKMEHRNRVGVEPMIDRALWYRSWKAKTRIRVLFDSCIRSELAFTAIPRKSQTIFEPYHFWAINTWRGFFSEEFHDKGRKCQEIDVERIFKK